MGTWTVTRLQCQNVSVINNETKNICIHWLTNPHRADGFLSGLVPIGSSEMCSFVFVSVAKHRLTQSCWCRTTSANMSLESKLSGAALRMEGYTIDDCLSPTIAALQTDGPELASMTSFSFRPTASIGTQSEVRTACVRTATAMATH